MSPLMNYFMIISMIIIIMLSIPSLLSITSKKWFEKYSSFECGMNLFSNTRKPFSLRFFLLMVLFIIFDIEIAMILIIPMMPQWSLQMMLFIMLFIMILFNGIIYEWSEGSLNWKM